MSAFTAGVEEEYQLVDPVTADLRSSARGVLEGDWSGDIRREFRESTIEIGTSVCAGSETIHHELRRLRTQASAAAGAQDLRIVAAGVHPFGDWRHQQVTAGDRYARIAATYGRIARDEHNFGMHIHVAVTGDRMQLLDRVRWYIPHLMALSCSSPYYEGADTGFASYRSVLWRRWPASGPPPRLGSDAAFRDFVEAHIRAQVLTDERTLYWMIRPHPQFPTIEFRMCDVCPRIEDAVAIAALTRTIVFAAADGALQHAADSGALADAAPAATDDGRMMEAKDAVLSDDCWRAARFGLDARFVAPNAEHGHVLARDAIHRLLDVLRPAAEQIDEADALSNVTRILERGNGADRLRAAHAARRDLVGATHWLADETMHGTGMDRRREPRDAV